MATSIEFNSQLLTKYNLNGPRYTSYPTALEFSEQYTFEDFSRESEQYPERPLSLYIHVPFCHSLCYYCGCNKIVTRHQDKADVYLDYLELEIVKQSQLFAGRKVKQLHLGGGTPSFLTSAQLSRLQDMLTHHFDFAQEREQSIEIDPREIELELLDHLATLGFNRLSFGVQDTNLEVQQAINRVQDTGFIAELMTRARTLGFRSINLDLVYGLPHQSMARFQQTLSDVLALNPDRISLFSYAHLPSRFAAQRKIKDQWLPQAGEKTELMLFAMKTLLSEGYQAIGMDHFAKPDDELAIAQKSGKLHRNFQGYTTLGDCDLLGLGVSSISSIGDSYSQNAKDLKEYYRLIETQGYALQKGLLQSHDDIIRGYVIRELMCHFEINLSELSSKFGIEAQQYFAEEMTQLADFESDRLVQVTPDKIVVLPAGRLLVRMIVMSFDRYLSDANRLRFSRVI